MTERLLLSEKGGTLFIFIARDSIDPVGGFDYKWAVCTQTSEINVGRPRAMLVSIAFINRNDFSSQPYVLYGKCLLMHELCICIFELYPGEHEGNYIGKQCIQYAHTQHIVSNAFIPQIN